jgi:ABC-type polysaccharide/polyol phosphate transport system ATPase subunit
MFSVSLVNISKRYLVYSSRKSLLRNLLKLNSKDHNSNAHHALSSINLEIPSGQCVGFIGRNGSGKSTLLRVIAGIVHPSNGEVRVNGRLSAVLDVQSGLHPRLTGRQNIFLKGAIHGLDKSQTKHRIQSIIDFSGLDKYIDYPINTYSSGMIIRLGFSIAMHMDFDILLMDEILSVGDIVFQRQCLAKVREFINQGRTILLATHNLGEIAAICNRVILLNKGRIQHDGETENVLQSYWEACERDQNRIPRHLHPFHPENVYGTDTGEIQIKDVKFLDDKKKERDTFWTGETMSVVIRFQSRSPIKDPLFRVQFYRNEGLWVHGVNTARVGFKAGLLNGDGEIVLKYQRVNLLEGDYYVTVGIWPDEHRSLMMDIAYDCHQWSYVLHIRSKRLDGAGIVSNPFSWRLTVNNGYRIDEAGVTHSNLKRP